MIAATCPSITLGRVADAAPAAQSPAVFFQLEQAVTVSDPKAQVARIVIRPFLLTISLALSFCANAAITESHGYAQFGVLKYPASFTHFDWVNPEAPKGGTLRMMAFGTFDTLNPYTFKGSSPVSTGNFLQYGVNELNEPLMVGTGQYDPSGDEPTSSYGLIAQSVEYSEDRSWVVFNLRPQARFHDGKPITAYDVAFSYRTLLKDGHPQYRTALQEVQRVDILNRHRIRFVFKRSGNPLLILRLGELPVLPQHYWKNRDFKATTFEPPLGSGPYSITRVQPGRQLVFERVKDYWGKDLPVNRGKYNFDRVEVEFYRDSDVAFEAFKAGEFDIYIEHQAKNWANGYNFPAVANGQVIKAQIPHRIPTQTQGLFMNTRRAAFADIRVREALGLLFNFEWTNRTLFSDAYERSTSYYPNSEFSATGLPSGAEWLLLAPYRDQLPASLFTQPFAPSKTDGGGIPRDTLRKALKLLADAGWTLSDKGLLNADKQPLRFEILLVNPNLERILQPYIEDLQRLGIDAGLRTVDRAQYKQRLDRFDFDMILMTLQQTLSPGLEQWQYFHSSQAAINGSKNYAGIANPVVDALLNKLLGAQTRDEQVAAARALDRVLLAQHYSIPNWYLNNHRLAYRNRFAMVTTPPYTLGLRAWWLKTLEKPR
ncbi:putative ABC-type nickel/dipeptide/oligopeptide-type transport system, periplasmic substrate-binding protein [Pseudomonas savastanoi pv. nerii]|uniref:ABC transporter, periplasmic substrate-binding protein n=1 Tax=Pseudomonas savastanoi pv. nerii TaxID=360921 RepID=A0A0P9W9H4_PSESS|nr:extracellular solute-binding protein [Pseudomonas savastanoi]KPW64163.1 ABC transporter, periplasmic substrate-binding protein [Pseudomonas amygdali pv. ciccaronei]KPX97021.1 putative ABC-type nickel/dipeptide/oligopeptide-type transport system, periplasmic substrate-binding protein [Pseudomonas savastanoi pv. nerii]KPY72229.1 ABC transporter, periplasmic substrate-binding protein [Pseudomonas savastanoi pv. savastanoi]KUG43815.1 putative ABC-type nickel/dipeptide/oligopeptide-type transport